MIMEICKAEIKTQTQLAFGAAQEIAALVRNFLPCGRVALIACGEENFSVVRTVRAALRGFESYCMVIGGEENAATLFSLPDDVRAAVAVANGAFGIARYFCTLRSAYCILVPTEADLRAAFANPVSLRIVETRSDYPVALPHAVFFDATKIGGYAGAYGALCMTGLSSLDCEINEVFGGCRRGGKALNELFAETMRLTSTGGNAAFREKLLSLSARYAMFCAQADFCTDGEVFFDLLSEQLRCGRGGGALFAFYYLIERYRHFFRWGIPRDFFVPDYPGRMRAAARYANADERSLLLKNKVPSVRRADFQIRTFNETRTVFYRKTESVAVYADRVKSTLFALGAKSPQLSAVQTQEAFSVTAELSDTTSVPSLMRDFGLLTSV